MTGFGQLVYNDERSCVGMQPEPLRRLLTQSVTGVVPKGDRGNDKKTIKT